MAFLASMFDPNKGAGFQASGATQQSGVNPYQLSQTYRQAQEGLQGQQAGTAQQQAFLNALASQGGIGNQSDVFAQQQGLANQLGEQAQGGGPNPALAQLAQTTGQNAANQAALMASQRGSGSNPGLMARQIANQGAGIQQQAAGQAATMRAQQQLAAQQALQQQQGMMGNLSTQQIGQQAGGLGNLNSMLQGQTQAAQGLHSQMQGANQAQNQASVAMQSNINNAQAGIAQGNQKASAGLLGGLLGGAGGLLGLAEGGEVPSPGSGPMSHAGKFFKDMSNSMASDEDYGGIQKGMSGLMSGLGSGLRKQAAQSTPVAGFTMPQLGSQFAGNAPSLGVMPMAQPQGPGLGIGHLAQGGKVKDMKGGGKVPGDAKVKGDSLKNDTVPAMLSPKEIVIPRSITMGENAPDNAAKFVAAILAKQRMKK